MQESVYVKEIRVTANIGGAVSLEEARMMFGDFASTHKVEYIGEDGKVIKTEYGTI